VLGGFAIVRRQRTPSWAVRSTETLAMTSPTYRRMTVYLGADDRCRRGTLSTEIVRRAQAAGLRGASVIRGVEGFGRAGIIHTVRILVLSDGLPVQVVIVDEADRVAAFLQAQAELLDDVLVTVEEVEVFRPAAAVPRQR
jgi:uncharacterized protein